MGDIRTEGSSAISEIDISRIEPNPDQPRRSFDETTLEELAASIRELGVVQPLTLRMNDEGNYQIIAGERRWRAARKAGLTSVPAYVRTVSDSEMTEMALIENIQREDLNAIEVALGFKKLIDSYNLTQERLSERLGKQVIKEGVSVRAVEELGRKLAEGENHDAPAKVKSEKSADIRMLEKDFTSYFSMPVKVSRSQSGKGSVTFKFASDDELHQLVKIFERLKQ